MNWRANDELASGARKDGFLLTFSAIQSTFRCLEMYSIKSVSVRSSYGYKSLLEITRASVLFFPKILDAI